MTALDWFDVGQQLHSEIRGESASDKPRGQQSEDRLANLGVMPAEIFQALANQNLVTPAGSIQTNGPEVQVRVDGSFDDLHQGREADAAEASQLGEQARGAASPFALSAYRAKVTSEYSSLTNGPSVPCGSLEASSPIFFRAW